MNPDETPLPKALTRRGRARWWRRVGASPDFQYVQDDGKPVEDSEAQDRIRALKIPPAWHDVRISPRAGSRLQAIGLDGLGRVQYLYHAGFVANRQRSKFARIERFGEHLPHLRNVTTVHLCLPGVPKERVLALMTRLIHALQFRPGSEDSVSAYQTYGVTTLRTRHLRISEDGAAQFQFDGKHHVPTRRVLVDEHLAKALVELKALGPGKLFRYRNGDENLHAVTAKDLNDYIKALTGPEFSAKDFRTWAGTLLVATELARLGRPRTEREQKRCIAQAVRSAAKILNNTPAVCRDAYLHPVILRLYKQGVTLADVRANPDRIHGIQNGLLPEEMEMLHLFRAAHAPRPKRFLREGLTLEAGSSILPPMATGGSPPIAAGAWPAGSPDATPIA